MSETSRPDLEALARMREQMLESLQAEGEADRMEGFTFERLRDAMYRPNALETMAELLSSGPGSASEGAPAPDFELPHLPGHGGAEGQTVALSSHFGRRPVGLIFGSYT